MPASALLTGVSLKACVFRDETLPDLDLREILSRRELFRL
jgi:hypothetical protein